MYYEELARMVRVFEAALYGSKLERAVNEGQCLCLILRAHRARVIDNREIRLIFDVDPRHLRFHISHLRVGFGMEPSSFCMLIRKHLRGLRVRSVEIDSKDRIVRMMFGRLEESLYIVEGYFWGRRSDVVLKDVSGVWLGSFRGRMVDAEKFEAQDRINSESIDRFQGVDDFELIDYLDAYYGELLVRESFESLKSSVCGNLRQKIKKSEKLLGRLKDEYERASAWERYQGWGDLLSAYYYQVVGQVRGKSEIHLQRFDGSGEEVILLDVKKDLRGNIEGFYKSSKRLQRGMRHLEERMILLEDEVFKYREELKQIESVVDIEVLKVLVGEGGEAKGLGRVEEKQEQKVSEKRKCYRRFYSEAGIEIRVGRSAEDNDTLTFRESKGNEYWLHAVGCSGSHVIIKSTDPDSETVMDACHLAHCYSSRRKMSSGEVYLVRQKFLRRIKGGKAGQVSIGGDSRVIKVNVDQSRLCRLDRS